ncbi:cyclin-D4-2-like [Arachis stenosperma]|uniref:cyclin-D4-2-like n=1 Tax=Arachis stenosperma TaxID=217475 RepID=UPI0025AC4EFD|nr:cyclin-D4-2-like [Arachis stenosperma]
MAPSFDCVSSLLCAEDTSFFDDNPYGGSGGAMDEVFDEDSWRPRCYNNKKGCNFDGDEADGYPLQSDECVAVMVEKECEHWHGGAAYLNRLQSGDLDFGARNEAIHWIEKVRAHFGFGPLCEYLSINYLDRFLSSYELPKGRTWTMQLLAVACLSIAAKIDETEVPFTLDLQVGESKFVFEAKTIQRMELLVLSTLRWRMNAITPFSFIDYFLSKINDGNESPSLRSSILRSIQLILSTTRGIEFLEFKPSEIAAAVAISVVGETEPVDTEKTTSVLIQYIDKGRVLKCLELIKELALNIVNVNDPNVSSSTIPCGVPQSPIGVLDALCFSYKSDDSNAGSCASSSHTTPDPKRRKLNKTCGSEALL